MVLQVETATQFCGAPRDVSDYEYIRVLYYPLNSNVATLVNMYTQVSLAFKRSLGMYSVTVKRRCRCNVCLARSTLEF